MEEIWKDVIGHEGIYRISTLGKVFSEPRNGTNGGLINISIDSRGYNYVVLYKNNIRKNYLFHRLLAQHFIPNQNNLLYINHKNSIKTDNSLENLEWVTCQENISHYRIKSENTNTVGISKRKDRGWIVRITFNNKRKYLGEYNSEEEAISVHSKFMIENNIINKYAVTN